MKLKDSTKLTAVEAETPGIWRAQPTQAQRKAIGNAGLLGHEFAVLQPEGDDDWRLMAECPTYASAANCCKKPGFVIFRKTERGWRTTP